MPDDIAERWQRAGSRGATARRAWLKRLARHPQRAEFERVIAGRLPENFHEAVAALQAPSSPTTGRTSPPAPASQKALEALVPAMPELVGGSADLTGSNLTLVKGMGTVAARQLTPAATSITASASTAWRRR